MPRHVAVLIFPGVQALDAVGPLEVFATASRLMESRGQKSPYRLSLIGPTTGTQLCRSGYGLVTDEAYSSLRDRLDTLIVAGGVGARSACRDAKLLAWLQRNAPRVRRLCSVCTGALILAEAGLLAGRRATTHWSSTDALQADHPDIRVEHDPIYVKDGKVYTSAGVTAGMDLALALVEEDLGTALTREVARWLVVFMQRPGGQAQFSTQLAHAPPTSGSLRELAAFVADNPGDNLSVDALARRARMSPRTFARRFREELGVTPARYVSQVRIEAAKRQLEQTRLGVDAIAAHCGFGSDESMRRAFVRQLRICPKDYRARFA